MSANKESTSFQRTLIYFAIVHTQADMGALSESLRKATLEKLGQNGWERKVTVVEKMWTEIEQVIDGMDLPYERVRLYQDGLPVCGREAEIIADLAKAGSRNHLLVLRLFERGATIMGTESAELLLEEYELVKQFLAEDDNLESMEAESDQKTLSESLLKRRDQFIAERINKTLGAGETGIIFLGLLHSLEDILDKDIRVTYPLLRPGAHGGKDYDAVQRSSSDC